MPIRRQFLMTGLVAVASLKAADPQPAVPLGAADPHLSAEERTQLLQWLDESHKEFFAAIDGVSDAQWKWKACARAMVGR